MIAIGIICVIILLVLISHISTLISWNKIKVGDTAFYIDMHNKWHNVACSIEVIEKHKDYMVIKYGDIEEVIQKQQYIEHSKTFNWD